MTNCLNCIYFGGKDEDVPNLYVCKYRKSLFSQRELDDGTMGQHCRLWDAYIPKEATAAEIEYAEKWLKMGYSEQPDYYEYFNGITNLYD